MASDSWSISPRTKARPRPSRSSTIGNQNHERSECKPGRAQRLTLKGEPQSELELTGSRCGGRICPCRWVEAARTSEDQYGAHGRCAKRRMIHQVEKFSSKLKWVV